MKTLFENAMLKNLKLKNRIIRSATWEALSDKEGHISNELLSVYEKIAAGGAGNIITGFTSVADNDYNLRRMVRLSNDSLIDEHARLVDVVHKHNCPIIVQLALGEYSSEFTNVSIDKLTKQDILAVQTMFIAAANRAYKSGYDGIQLHAAHGFFLSRFISPAYNHRTDEYGGSTNGRSKLLIDILREIKSNLPDFHVTLKINCNDFFEDGLTPAQSLEICNLCANNDIDSIEVSGNGPSVPGIKAGENEAYFKDFAFALAKAINIPVILTGGHRSVESMEKIINQGVNFLSVSRPLIREPNLIHRWQGGDLSPAFCVSCNMCYHTTGHKCIFNE